MSFGLFDLQMRDEDFWNSTPYEIHRRRVAWQRKVEEDWQIVRATGWFSAMYSRAKRLPPLKAVIFPPASRKVEGAELKERRSELERLASFHGVTIHGDQGRAG